MRMLYVQVELVLNPLGFREMSVDLYILHLLNDWTAEGRGHPEVAIWLRLPEGFLPLDLLLKNAGRSSDEAKVTRRRVEWSCAELGMRLHADKVWVLRACDCRTNGRRNQEAH